MHWIVFPPSTTFIWWSPNPQCLQVCLYLEVQFAEQVVLPGENRKDTQEERVPVRLQTKEMKDKLPCDIGLLGGPALLPALRFREGLCILPTIPFILPGLSGFAFLATKQLLTKSVSMPTLFPIGIVCQRPDKRIPHSPETFLNVQARSCSLQLY